MKIWMVKDLDKPMDSYFARSLREVKRLARENYNYANFGALRRDGWVGKPERVEVPGLVAKCVIESQASN